MVGLPASCVLSVRGGGHVRENDYGRDYDRGGGGDGHAQMYLVDQPPSQASVCPKNEVLESRRQRLADMHVPTAAGWLQDSLWHLSASRVK